MRVIRVRVKGISRIGIRGMGVEMWEIQGMWKMGWEWGKSG